MKIQVSSAAAGAVLVICLALWLGKGKKLNMFTGRYSDFDAGRDKDTFIREGNSSIHLKAMHVTSSNPVITNLSGRILLNRRFHLWEDLARQLSFNTSFLANIFPINNGTQGGGLAFVIVPDLAGPPPRSTRGYLGLTNAFTDGNSMNRLVAVEHGRGCSK